MIFHWEGKEILPYFILVYCSPISKLDVGFQITQIGPVQPKLWTFYSEGSERISCGRGHLAELTSLVRVELLCMSCG